MLYKCPSYDQLLGTVCDPATVVLFIIVFMYMYEHMCNNNCSYVYSMNMCRGFIELGQWAMGNGHALDKVMLEQSHSREFENLSKCYLVIFGGV